MMVVNENIISSSKLPVMSTTNRMTKRFRRLLYSLGMIGIIGLGLYNQPYSPSFWLDEGFVVQGAMNLVRYGKYAMKSSEGFRVLDQPLIANGPGLVLPIAASFQLFGIGALQARLVVVAFMVLTVFIYFFIGKRIFGEKATILGLILMIAIPQEGFLIHGRMAMGNIPALAYLLIGYLFWLRDIEHKKFIHVALSGLFFGLSIVTKAQNSILVAAFLIVVVVDYFFYKTYDIKRYFQIILLTLGFVALWFIAQYILVGKENFPNHLAALRASSQVTVFAFSSKRIPLNIRYLIKSGAPIFILPGLIYSAWISRKRSLSTLQQLPLAIMVFLWLSWYSLASIGWNRYALDAYILSSLLSGKLVIDSIQHLRGNRENSSQNNRYIKWGIAGYITIVLLWTTWGLFNQISSVVKKPVDSITPFSNYLLKNINPKAVIESWEWQIDLFADLNYHHPTNEWVDKGTLHLFFGIPFDEDYQVSIYDPEYLINGPNAKGIDLYSKELSRGNYTLIYSVPPYDLLKVEKP